MNAVWNSLIQLLCKTLLLACQTAIYTFSATVSSSSRSSLPHTHTERPTTITLPRRCCCQLMNAVWDSLYRYYANYCCMQCRGLYCQTAKRFRQQSLLVPLHLYLRTRQSAGSAAGPFHHSPPVQWLSSQQLMESESVVTTWQLGNPHVSIHRPGHSKILELEQILPRETNMQIVNWSKDCVYRWQMNDI